MTAAGKGLVAVLVLAASVLAAVPAAQAAFPGHNGRIAFASAREGDAAPSFGLYTMRADGSDQRTVGDLPGFRPAWSADGSRLAYEFGGAVRLVSADGSGLTTLAVECCRAFAPSWAPDGQRVAFTRGQASHPEVLTTVLASIDPAGPRTELEGALGGGDVDPSWSPDGTRIAFTVVSEFPSPTSEIWVMNVDGTDPVRLTTAGFSGSPDWSPDGARLAFSRSVEGNRDIWVMDADGGNQLRLTDEPDSDSEPAWSPDGTRIAFTRNPLDGNGEIYSMNADGTGALNLTRHPGHDLAPTWQPLRGPRREDFKNASAFCKAEREFLGEEGFRSRYGGRANAHGKCVSGTK